MDKELEMPATGSIWQGAHGKWVAVIGEGCRPEGPEPRRVIYEVIGYSVRLTKPLDEWHETFKLLNLNFVFSNNPKSEAAKGKRQYHLVPVCVLDEITDGMAEGARKYGAYNWRKTGVSMADYYDSTQRHLNAWLAGQDIDPDSGVHEISKAITSLVVLRDAIAQGKALDDRPKGVLL